ncbi:MAG: precorrin-6A reductase [Eubacteriaceae bacterium]|nr:precorrin-6A reductase [Eubacteriaceae bacterium]
MKFLVFGGTSESRVLSDSLGRGGHSVTLSVATDFGKSLAEENGSVGVVSGKLDVEGMSKLIGDGDYDFVVDATHPYALDATQNIQLACRASSSKYIRLRRPDGDAAAGVAFVPDAIAAAEILEKSDGKALLAIGSSQLEAFTHIKSFADRFYVRLLPMADSIHKAMALGYKQSNLICMQGPFSEDINRAMLKMVQAKFLVTKESGNAGGFAEKVSAAESVGAATIAISRPTPAEKGYLLEELLDLFDTSKKAMEKNSRFFPLFVDLAGKKALVAGAGEIAERRIKTLVSFGAKVLVVSPEATAKVQQAAEQGDIQLVAREYCYGDIAAYKPFIALAATNDRQANHNVMLEAKSMGIPVSVADCREECTFYFPAIAEDGAFIAGVVSKAGDHAGVREMAKTIRGCMGI